MQRSKGLRLKSQAPVVAAACLALTLVVGGEAFARESTIAANATVEALFTPGDAIDRRLVSLIDDARSEVLVQAFTFTSRRIANALEAAHRRGVRVEVIADRAQAVELPGSVVASLMRNGVVVWLDGRFAAAHNKVIVIDGQSGTPVLVTGSYNYTVAAQTRNAENALIVRGDRALAARYRDNFIALRAGIASARSD